MALRCTRNVRKYDCQAFRPIISWSWSRCGCMRLLQGAVCGQTTCLTDCLTATMQELGAHRHVADTAVGLRLRGAAVGVSPGAPPLLGSQSCITGCAAHPGALGAGDIFGDACRRKWSRSAFSSHHLTTPRHHQASSIITLPPAIH